MDNTVLELRPEGMAAMIFRKTGVSVQYLSADSFGFKGQKERQFYIDVSMEPSITTPDPRRIDVNAW